MVEPHSNTENTTDKEVALAALEEEMAQDDALPLRESNLVFGEGRADAEVMFIGEAPGFYENEQRRPFVGRAGNLLTRSIESLGWARSDVYITNIVKRRPPDNRDPLPDEIAAYAPYLAEQIRVIAPPVIVPLGRFAMDYFISDAKITRDQGKIFRKEQFCVVPMLHPAAALRGTGAREQFEKTFRKLPAIIKKCKSLPPPKRTPKPKQSSLL